MLSNKTDFGEQLSKYYVEKVVYKDTQSLESILAQG